MVWMTPTRTAAAGDLGFWRMRSYLLVPMRCTCFRFFCWVMILVNVAFVDMGVIGGRAVGGDLLVRWPC